jgi:hypothetical protein
MMFILEECRWDYRRSDGVRKVTEWDLIPHREAATRKLCRAERSDSPAVGRESASLLVEESMMWENLLRVDWKNLHHAYGRADDAPAMLWHMMSGDPA